MTFLNQLRGKLQAAMSMVELLIVVVVIGIVATLALPTISNLRKTAVRTTAIQNAKNISQMSAALAALGVAHVIPDSMGGVAATARLLREGVIVPEGPMAGEKFVLSGLRDDEIESISEYLFVQYDKRELRLIFQDPFLNETREYGSQGDWLLCGHRATTQPVTIGLLAVFGLVLTSLL